MHFFNEKISVEKTLKKEGNMIYILRHGLDDERFIGGWSNVELVGDGIEQVKRTVKFMQEHSIVFDKIYSSDIKRAVQTAQLVSDAYHIPIELQPCLRELDKGILTGMPKEKAEALFSDFVGDVDISTSYPEGESMLNLYKRQKEVLEWIMGLERCLIVTHRGPINMYYFYLKEETLTNDKKRFGVTHASLHELDTKQKILRKIYEPKEKMK